MPLALPPTFGLSGQTNLTASARAGTTVTASSTANVKGSWTELINSTNMASYGIWIILDLHAASAAQWSCLVDIGYNTPADDAQTNVQVVIPDLNGGASGISGDLRGKRFYFPVYIPEGRRVSARMQASTGNRTTRVSVWLEQASPYAPITGGAVEAYGANTSTSRGTDVTRGNGSFGSWVEIATTSRAHRFWTVAMDGSNDTTLANADVVAELGIGPDSSNVTSIWGPIYFVEDNTEIISGPFPLLCYRPVPSGTKLFLRAAAGDTEARGFVIYGVD